MSNFSRTILFILGLALTLFTVSAQAAKTQYQASPALGFQFYTQDCGPEDQVLVSATQDGEQATIDRVLVQRGKEWQRLTAVELNYPADGADYHRYSWQRDRDTRNLKFKIIIDGTRYVTDVELVFPKEEGCVG